MLQFLPACSLPSQAARPSGDSVLTYTADGPLSVSAPPNISIPRLWFVDSRTSSTVKSPPPGDVGENTLSFVDCNIIYIIVFIGLQAANRTHHSIGYQEHFNRGVIRGRHSKTSLRHELTSFDERMNGVTRSVDWAVRHRNQSRNLSYRFLMLPATMHDRITFVRTTDHSYSSQKVWVPLYFLS